MYPLQQHPFMHFTPNDYDLINRYQTEMGLGNLSMTPMWPSILRSESIPWYNWTGSNWTGSNWTGTNLQWNPYQIGHGSIDAQHLNYPFFSKNVLNPMLHPSATHELVNFIAEDRRRDIQNDSNILNLSNSLRNNRQSDQIIRSLANGIPLNHSEIIARILADRQKDICATFAIDKVICDRIQNRHSNHVLERLNFNMNMRRPDCLIKDLKSMENESIVRNLVQDISAQDKMVLNPQIGISQHYQSLANMHPFSHGGGPRVNICCCNPQNGILTGQSLVNYAPHVRLTCPAVSPFSF